MAYQPLPITPFRTGLNIDQEPFQIPMDGFTEIVNGHIRHGHVDKRAGYTLLASLAGGTPVMGLYTFYDNSNAANLIAFDQTDAYTFSAVVPATFSVLAPTPIFTSGESDFVWAVNWQASNLKNRLYFTNDIADEGDIPGTDGIWFYDGTSPLTQITDPNAATVITDLGSGGRELRGGRLIFSMKQRLLVLNTLEYDGSQVNRHPQRARWCQAQGPSNWDDITPGGGGFVDAPTGEHIVSARSLQNQIIVFFTNSVWTIQTTSDPSLPFRWSKINDYRACNAKMGSVGYDRYVVAFGKRGITATDGVETRRIDDRIQAFIPNFVHQDSFAQVFCARDYNEKRFWTLYPSNEDGVSSGALIYDDDSSSWSLYDIDMNVLGYADNGFDWKYSDFTAANNHDWSYNEDENDETYDSFFWQGDAEYFIGGDTTGNVFRLGDGPDDNGTAIELNLATGNWNPYEQQGVECQMGYVDFFVQSDTTSKFTVQFFKDNDVDFYEQQELDCLPDLGFIADLTNITQANPGVVTSFQHGLSTNDIVFIYAVEGMDGVNTGPYTITVIDTGSFSIGVDTSAFGAYTGDGQIFDRQFYRTKVWKRAYAGGIGYLHKMKISSPGENRSLEVYEYKPWFRQRGKRELG